MSIEGDGIPERTRQRGGLRWGRSARESRVALGGIIIFMAGNLEADRSTVLRTLRSLEPELRAQGVRHVSVFGSVARGEETPASDIDLALDLAPGAAPTGFQFVTYVERLKVRLASVLSRNVDVVILPARRRELQDALSREAIAAF